MIVLGLTGSIGMGKSTAAAMLRGLGVAVFDSDAEVHKFLAAGGAGVARVVEIFSGVEDGAGGVDRKKLGAAVFGDGPALRQLEAVLHPLVRRAQIKFRRRALAARRALVVLDVPLLFETGGERNCDATCVVSAPAFVQAARVLARPGMTAEKFQAILGQQVPDAEKRRRADFVVAMGAGKNFALRRLRGIVRALGAGSTKTLNKPRKKAHARNRP
jgi:dephospho-CoA kinase